MPQGHPLLASSDGETRPQLKGCVPVEPQLLPPGVIAIGGLSRNCHTDWVAGDICF